MKEPILVVLAAGMGSRYGGLKQIDPIGPNGEIILELSIFDAIKAGFKRVLFIIKKEIEEDFKEALVSKLPKDLEISYVFQSVDQIPEGYHFERQKPWGTAHALRCCYGAIDAPFGVINADDFYGYESFEKLYHFLKNNPEGYSIISYVLKNTLTEHGSVARGVCEVANGKLTGVTERTKIERINGEVAYFENDVWYPLDENSPVSMNMWGLPVSFVDYLYNEGFKEFLDTLDPSDVKSEYFIPLAIDTLMKEKGIEVENIVSNAKWFGVTYQADKEKVKAGIKALIDNKEYPEHLWKK